MAGVEEWVTQPPFLPFGARRPERSLRNGAQGEPRFWLLTYYTWETGAAVQRWRCTLYFMRSFSSQRFRYFLPHAKPDLEKTQVATPRLTVGICLSKITSNENILIIFQRYNGRVLPIKLRSRASHKKIGQKKGTAVPLSYHAP